MLLILFIIIIFLYLLNYYILENNKSYIQVFLINFIELIKYNKNPDISPVNYSQIKKPNTTGKFKVKINPIIENLKYRLYGEDNLIFKKAGIIKQQTDVDQTTNINIMNHVNNSTNKTIKDIYNEITNDNRNININLDNLDANDPTDNYNINKQYGATQFDTYSMKN